MDAPSHADPAVFFHLRMVLSMVVSLGIAKLLSGVARFVQHPGRQPAYWVHVVWALSLLLAMMHFWWWEFSLQRVGVWRFEAFFFLIAYAALYYLLCAVLFPDDLAEYSGYRAYFYSRRPWFFGLLAAVFVADLVDTWLKGSDYVAAQGAAAPLRTAAYVLLCIVAACVSNARFHAVFAVANLAAQVGWILHRYDVIKV